VFPVGINGDEKILTLHLNKEKSILKINTDKQAVYFEIASRKQLPVDLVSFNSKYSAKELKLNLREPSDNSSQLNENISIDNGYNLTYDSVAFSKKFTIVRAGSKLKLKNNKNRVFSQIQLSGLGNFRLYQCIYWKCKDLYFIIPWDFGSIQNSIVVINSKTHSIMELNGKLLQTTAIMTELTDNIVIQTRDSEDFTEHQGGSELILNLFNPSTLVKSYSFGCINPSYLNDHVGPFYSSDYNYLIHPEILPNSEVLLSVLDSSQSLVFTHQMKLEEFNQINEVLISQNRRNCAIASHGTVIRTYDIIQHKISRLNEFSVFEFCKMELLTNNDLVVFDAYEWSAWDESDFYIIQNYREISKVKISDLQGLYGYGVFNGNCLFLPDSGKVVIYNLIDRNKNVLYSGGEFEDIFAYHKLNSMLLYYQESERSIKIIETNSNQTIYTIYPLLNNNYLVKLPNSPYYMCSKDASKMLHYVTPSLKVIGFEQLDPVYNRPDIVLDSIGKYFGEADKELVANYRQSWEKRIDRLGLDKEKLGKGEIAVPNADIVGADDIAFENKEGKLNISVSANDPKYPLRRFNVYVNEVPLYGSAGVSIAHLKKQVWDTTVSVPLSVGENKIQVSVMNELGLENFKYPTYVNYTPENNIVSKTYYIGIGVNEFKEAEHNLKYCVKDITDLAKSFAGANTEVKLFTDKQVTKENILALKDYLNKTSVNDKVIISCSSHGLLDDSLNFYLAMHDVDFDNPKARGLKYEELESLLDGIPARQKLLLLDACNSGENDKTELLKQELKQKEQSMESSQVLAARGVIIQLEEENKSNFKKMNELFVNVRNNTGSVIISAAGGQESALESIKVDGKTIENGAFTYSILECLEQNEGKELKVNTLKQYAEKRVEEITNGKQKPTSRQETMEVDWGVR